jgi:hypothetical protein
MLRDQDVAAAMIDGVHKADANITKDPYHRCGPGIGQQFSGEWSSQQYGRYRGGEPKCSRVQCECSVVSHRKPDQVAGRWWDVPFS